jgi:hypothetical protein
VTLILIRCNTTDAYSVQLSDCVKMLLLMLIILVISIVYYFVHLKYQYWAKRGVVGPRPKFFVGNFGGCLLLKTSPGDLYSNIYK